MARETNGWLHIICYAKQTHNTISTFVDMNDAIKQAGEICKGRKSKSKPPSSSDSPSEEPAEES